MQLDSWHIVMHYASFLVHCKRKDLAKMLWCPMQLFLRVQLCCPETQACQLFPVQLQSSSCPFNIMSLSPGNRVSSRELRRPGWGGEFAYQALLCVCLCLCMCTGACVRACVCVCVCTLCAVLASILSFCIHSQPIKQKGQMSLQQSYEVFIVHHINLGASGKYFSDTLPATCQPSSLSAAAAGKRPVCHVVSGDTQQKVSLNCAVSVPALLPCLYLIILARDASLISRPALGECFDTVMRTDVSLRVFVPCRGLCVCVFMCVCVCLCVCDRTVPGPFSPAWTEARPSHVSFQNPKTYPMPNAHTVIKVRTF